MSEPPQPDGQSPEPPHRFDDLPASSDSDGSDSTGTSDLTPERAERPDVADTVERPAPDVSPADPTVTPPSRPAAQQPASQQPASQQPASQQPTSQQPPGRYPAAPPPGSHQPAGQYPPVEYPAGQQPPVQYPPVDYPPVEYPAGQQPPVQYPPVDYPAAQYPPGQYPPGQYPPSPQQPVGAGGPPHAAAGPGNAPSDPGFGGPQYDGPSAGGPGAGGPPDGGPPQYGVPSGQDDGSEKKSGLLVAGLVALVVALAGALGFVLLQDGDEVADPVTTDVRDDEVEATVETTEAVTSPPPTEPTTTEVLLDGSVDGVFVHVESFAEVLAEADLDATLRDLGLADGNNPVSSADPVLNLCAAMTVDMPVSATVDWLLDNETLSEGAQRVFAAPADGNCINNSGEPLASGVYEVSFTDASGSTSGVAVYTVGAPTVTQEFLNDSDSDLCAVELAPTAAGFFQSFEVNGGDALVPGDSILIDIADVEHEVRSIDCDEAASESFFTTPGADPISLTSGDAIVPTTTTTTTTTTEPPPLPQITLGELNEVVAAMASLDIAVTPGSVDEQAAIDALLDAGSNLRIATEDQSLALCAAWDVPGPFEGQIVWEFNREVIARFPVSTDGGGIGGCIPPGGAEFDEGAYQTYLERGDDISLIETFTVGRAETQLTFINDTGVPICRVGFSPNLTNWYTFYDFSDFTDFDGSIEPADGFTITAPFIENDIRAFDCEGDQVSEALNIPPTDQLLALSTGTA